MLYLIISILFYLLVMALLVLWLVNYFRKVLLHWEYMKYVEGKFEKYQSYWDTVFSFDFSIVSDIIMLLLPVYRRSPHLEEQDADFKILGDKLKRVFWWGWGSFIAIIVVQIVMLIVTLLFEIF
ncbi:MAG: hypothetical protein AAFQ94_03820 [Bacteroidota bacterium]